jgi:hypothetical protein
MARAVEREGSEWTAMILQQPIVIALRR